MIDISDNLTMLDWDCIKSNYIPPLFSNDVTSTLTLPILKKLNMTTYGYHDNLIIN